MARRRNRGTSPTITIVVAMGLLVLIAYVFYWSPRQVQQEMHREIAQWGVHWTDAKECILGANATSSDYTEAMTARALLGEDDIVALRECEKHLKALKRPGNSYSDNLSVENAWTVLRKNVLGLAQAHAWRCAETPNAPIPSLRKKLADAMDILDVTHNRLRAAADLAPIVRSSEPLKTLRDTDIALLPPGATKVTNLLVSASELHYFSSGTDGKLWRSTYVRGISKHRRLSPLALPANGANWGLWLESNDVPVVPNEAPSGSNLVAGPLDELGDPAGDGSLLQTLAENETVIPIFAIGSQHRSVLYQHVERKDTIADYQYRLLTSSDSGNTWKRESLPSGELWVDLGTRTWGNHISFHDPEQPEQSQWMALTAGGVVHHTLPFVSSDSCDAPNRTWWTVGLDVYTLDVDGVRQVKGSLPNVPQSGTENFQMHCTDDALAVVHTRIGEGKRQLGYRTCTPSQCTTTAQDLPLGEAEYQLVFHDRSWHVITHLNNVLAIWKIDANEGTPQFVSNAIEGGLVGALSSPKALLLVFWPKDGTAPIVRSLY